jgi:hypothetical protein
VTSIDREPGRTFARLEAQPLAALGRGRGVPLIDTPQPVEPPDEGATEPVEAALGAEPAPDGATPDGVTSDAEQAAGSTEPEAPVTEAPPDSEPDSAETAEEQP